ncbi:MAG: transcription antitermination factor NusB [Acidimicrobiaceae bacterium]|nr:transcription antitermination factor NusB [Acidimicrobiaceae bacterium]
MVDDDRIAIPGFGLRREAREDALVVLYEIEIAGHSIEEALSRRAIPMSDYAVGLIRGVQQDIVCVDHILGRHLVGWSVQRLAIVDRILARVAVWELINRHDVPTGVVLSEVVSLATRYCGSESPRFLNGVIAAVALEVRGAEVSNSNPDQTP